MELQQSDFGGIVVCGGKSTRMGRSKALLPFGPELMLQRVVRILSDLVSPVVVVAAQSQELPNLPAGTLIVRDEHESLGPLAGLAVGLAALRGRSRAAYVSACDTPLLQPAFVRKMLGLLETHDVAIPRDGRFHHPLAAVYRVDVEPIIQGLLASDQLRPVFLLPLVDALEIDVADLRDVDPDLATLRNTNTPADYETCLREAGFCEIG